VERVSKLAEYLNRHIVGNVFDRPSICEGYATDRSILKIIPRLVAIPECTDDIRKLLRFANQLANRDFSLPVTVRGTGMDKTGASIGDGLIISMEKFCHIEEIDVRGRLVRVQPGITLGALNEALRLQGMWLPIDANPKLTIGGLIANCTTDSTAQRYGGIFHFVDRAEVVLANGDTVQMGPLSLFAAEAKANENTSEGELYRKISKILDKHDDTILDRTMRPYDAMGYANIIKVREPHSVNLLPLMFASQGTLGVISDVILHVETIPQESSRLLVSFHDLKAAQRFLNFACDLDPATVKICDLRIMEEAADHGKKSELFIRKIGRGLVVVIDFGYGKLGLKRRLKRCIEVLPPGTFYVEETPENQAAFACLDTALLTYLNEDELGSRMPVLDDVFIPTMHFGGFVEGLKTLEQTLGMELPVFGSFATSNYYVRPTFDYTSLDDRKKLVDFIRLYTNLVTSCQGSLTGNGPEGRVKALTTSKAISANERQLYASIKEAFDPYNILNPKVKLGADVKDTVRHLRTEDLPQVSNI